MLALFQTVPSIPQKPAQASGSAKEGVRKKTTTQQVSSPPLSVKEPRASGDDKASSNVSNPNEHITVVVQQPTSVPGWEKAYVLLTAGLVIVGAVGIRYAVKTLRAVQSQASTMQGQLEVMRGQLSQMQTSGEQTDKLIEHAENQAEALLAIAEGGSDQTKASLLIARATINSNEALQKSSDAAKLSADVAAGVSVPTLVLETFESKHYPRDTDLQAALEYPQVRITIKNCGQTPALLRAWWLIFTCEDLPEVPVYKGYPGSGMVFEKVVVEAGKSYALPENLPSWNLQKVEISDVKDIIERKKMLVAYGFVAYGNIFDSRVRRMKFCETALNIFPGLGGPHVHWVSDMGPAAYTGNEYTIAKSKIIPSESNQTKDTDQEVSPPSLLAFPPKLLHNNSLS